MSLDLIEFGDHSFSFSRKYFSLDPQHKTKVNRKAKNSKPDSEDFHYEAGLTYFAAERDDEAIKSFKRALKLNSSDSLFYYMLGRCYLIQVQEKTVSNPLENATKAIDMFNKAIQLKNDMASYHYFKSEAYYLLSKIDKCVKCLDKAISLQYDEALFHFKKGEVAYLKQNYAQAIECFQLAKQFNHSDAAYTHFMLGKSIYARALLENQANNDHLNLKTFTDAIESIDTALELNPNVAEYHSVKGRVFFSIEEFSDAIQSFEKALRLDPNDDKIYYWRGRAFKEMHNWTEAERDFQKAFDTNPLNAYKAYLDKVIVQKSSNTRPQRPILVNNRQITQTVNELLASLDQATNREPGKTEDLNYKKGIDLFYLKKYTDAISHFKAMIQISRNEPKLFYMYGRCVLNLVKEKVKSQNTIEQEEEATKAIGWFDKAIQLKAHAPYYHFFKGQAFHFLNKFGQAIDCYDQALRIKVFAMFHNEKGRALFGLDKLAEAVECFSKAIEVDPRKSDAYYMLGKSILAIALGKKRDAGLIDKDELVQSINYFNKAIELEPNQPKHFEWRGKAQQSIGKFDDAIESFNQAIRLNPTDDFFYFCKGRVHKNMNNLILAKKDFQMALNMNPLNKPCKQMLKDLE